MIAGTDFSRRRQGPFLAPLEIIVLATMVGALLYLLFPGRDFQDPKHLNRPDDLSMAYLRMLLRGHPDDADARLLLVQQQVALGRFEEAAETLQPLRGRGDAIGAKADVVALKLDRTRLFAIPPGDPQREVMQRDVRSEALRLLPRTSRVDDLADLADFVLSLGDPLEAARAYQRIATIDKANLIGWQEKAGRWFYAAGQPAQAAKAYSEAALATSDAKQGARLGRLAIIALLASNQGRAGLATARPIIEKYPRDLGLLEQAVRMAVAAGDLSSARRWGEQRVIAAGSSDQALREQIDILVKAGDPQDALKVAHKLLDRNPNDSGLHRQVAQLARWSSEPEESMAQWAWLARRGNEDARKTALDLAQKLSDDNLVVEMLEMRMKQAHRAAPPRVQELEQLRKQAPKRLPRAVSLAAAGGRRRPLAWPVAPRRLAQDTPIRRAGGQAATAPDEDKLGPPGTAKAGDKAGDKKPKPDKKKGGGDFQLAELISLADALESKGLPGRAIKAMDDFRFNFADRPEYWVRIALLYENSVELEQALACLEQLNRLKSAMTLDDAVRQARLLWRLLRPDAALTRLVALRGQARESETDYWRLVADLAWRVENDLLAAEAYGILWKTQKTADVAEPLFRTLDSLGRADEAITVAAEAYDRFNSSGFLVGAVDIAVREGMTERARSLFGKARGKEKQFELETHFWFQRAQLAASEERPHEAEEDLQHVLQIDPGSEDAHVEWVNLAVRVQDRGMAERALQHWGPSAEADVDSWGLLSDAYTLTGDETRALRFRRMAREERTRQRILSGRPMTPEEHMEEAVERRDRRALEAGLGLYGTSLSLPTRVAALRELGREEDAWDLLNAGGLAASNGRRTASSDDSLALAADIRELRENYLDGAWVTGSSHTLGELEEQVLGARFELRFGSFFVGAEGSFDKLKAPARPTLVEAGEQEQRGFLTLRLHERFGETSLRGGLEFLPEGNLPHVELNQRLSFANNRFEAHVKGAYGELPTHSALLRVAALRDGFDADVTVVVAGPFELGAQGSLSRFQTRGAVDLTTEQAGRVEMAFRLPIKTAFIRPRVDAFSNIVPPLENPPNVILRRLTPEQVASPEDVLALQYSSVGLGLQLGSGRDDVGEGRGPHVSLRYSLDAWGGYVFPAERASYAVDLGLGLVFARHQEISLEGFYYSDFRNAAGESYWGGSVNYTLRWFR